MKPRNIKLLTYIYKNIKYKEQGYRDIIYGMVDNLEQWIYYHLDLTTDFFVL